MNLLIDEIMKGKKNEKESNCSSGGISFFDMCSLYTDILRL